MAESPDGRGVILFGGKFLLDLFKYNDNTKNKKIILELRAGANSWTILDKTLENERYMHVVILLQ